MKRLLLALTGLAFAAAIASPPALADYGFKEVDVNFAKSDGSTATQAGSHPSSWTTTLFLNSFEEGKNRFPEGETKDLRLEFPPGLVGTPDPVPLCSAANFIEAPGNIPSCPNASAIGVVVAEAGFSGPEELVVPVFDLEPSPGEPAKIGFNVLGIPIIVDVGLNPVFPYNLQAQVTNIPQSAFFYGSKLTVWGNPAASSHDAERGRCIYEGGSCPVGLPEVPFVTLPRSCSGPLQTIFEADPWSAPGSFAKAVATTHDGSKPPQPLGLGGCAELGFSPRVSAQPTSSSAESPSGLDFDLDVQDEGLTNPEGTAKSDIRKAVVTLPEGVTINPSQAEGLGACTQAQFAAERADRPPSEGCPQSAKIGTVEVESKLLEGSVLRGALYVAAPYENPFNSLIALYMTFREPQLGLAVAAAGKVEADPRTGQLITTFDELPQLPFSHFHLHFREGGRSPLVTPPRCGDFTTRAVFTPWANPSTSYETTSTFKVASGVGGGACPPGGTPPFHPGFSAGTLNNNAGSYSPFYMRLSRRDGDQDLTKFSAALPPGMLAKLAGVGECPDSAIAEAKSMSGRQEQASPSCPAASRIGSVIGGAGVGPELLYVPGSVYLAGPFNGAPLSVVGIVPAVAGPFDVGDVVVRQALRVNPRSGEVSVDGAASDPLPHILAGIPLKVRDIRVSIDRQSFTLNPTSCEPFAVDATLWGGGSDVFSAADDSPAAASDRFQAANCANLGFKPSLALRLKGGTGRGAHPQFRATYTPRGGDANLAGLVLRLPHSAFLDQAHIRTVCTRVQYAAGACPPGSIYGQATVSTPLLAEPLQGPVYLRSSSHNLPDLVLALHGLVEFEAVARIDSKNGGIRATLEGLPDAPVTQAVVNMQGAKKGLIVNSTNLCAARHRAEASFTAHNGGALEAKPPVKAGCAKAKKRRRR